MALKPTAIIASGKSSGGSAAHKGIALSATFHKALDPPSTTEKPLSHTRVSILTGFLGSGKTTLLNRALREPAMANTAVVINEFGEISLDHALAAQSNDVIMVLENGCLCCTVFGDLVTTLNNLYHAREDGEIPRFDHVLIETSGLADPSSLIQAFLSDPVLAGLYRVGAMVATVDAINGPGTLDNHVESVRQAALADQILITKLDLIDATKVEEAEAALTARRNVGGSHAPGNRSAETELAGWSGRSLQTPRNRRSWSLSSSRSRERPL